ncbi:hypothetical protein [Nakamurella aerolata]|uniref:Uncharacterized protein n=1 Tax=Nakamurella aerolata TaxID=1656892 RepID=A0A849A8C2_9ACTN|nr:hypothetical protein [Nakamurella aerolata]NNG35866.1 hypothetical protein [Nakamurella aerolata]
MPAPPLVVSERRWERITGPRLLIDNVGDPRGHVERIVTSIRSADVPAQVAGVARRAD